VSPSAITNLGDADAPLFGELAALKTALAASS
jgi:hypothetical protein